LQDLEHFDTGLAKLAPMNKGDALASPFSSALKPGSTGF